MKSYITNPTLKGGIIQMQIPRLHLKYAPLDSITRKQSFDQIVSLFLGLAILDLQISADAFLSGPIS